jgi:uncharacterized cupredoxin-like copper-binding protein
VNRISPSLTTRGAVLLLTLALILAACNGGDTAAPEDGAADDGQGEEVAAGDDTFCDRAMAVGSPGFPEIDWENATEEEMATAQREFAEERLRPIVVDLRDSAPETLQGDVDTLERILDDAAEDGDLEPFFVGEGAEASERITLEAADRCGWQTVEVPMVDFAYEDVPESLEAGPVVFSAPNEGVEAHELVLLRRADDAEESWEEILAMEDDEAMQRAEFVTVAFAPAGESSSAVAELREGEYAMICAIPVGTDATGEVDGDGPPHFEAGMIATFTVG